MLPPLIKVSPFFPSPLAPFVIFPHRPTLPEVDKGADWVTVLDPAAAPPAAAPPAAAPPAAAPPAAAPPATAPPAAAPPAAAPPAAAPPTSVPTDATFSSVLAAALLLNNHLKKFHPLLMFFTP